MSYLCDHSADYSLKNSQMEDFATTLGITPKTFAAMYEKIGNEMTRYAFAVLATKASRVIVFCRCIAKTLSTCVEAEMSLLRHIAWWRIGKFTNIRPYTEVTQADLKIVIEHQSSRSSWPENIKKMSHQQKKNQFEPLSPAFTHFYSCETRLSLQVVLQAPICEARSSHKDTLSFRPLFFISFDCLENRYVLEATRARKTINKFQR